MIDSYDDDDDAYFDLISWLVFIIFYLKTKQKSCLS